MTRYEYIVVARHKITKETRQHVCWGDNKDDAIDHTRHALDLIVPIWTWRAQRTGKRASCVA